MRTQPRTCHGLMLRSNVMCATRYRSARIDAMTMLCRTTCDLHVMLRDILADVRRGSLERYRRCTWV
jgi:hypothetical protein